MSSSSQQQVLSAAYGLIGRALDVPLEPPAGGAAPRDAADWARANGIRTRRVLLSGAWWRNAHAPLLAYREADKQAVLLLPGPGRRYETVDPLSGRRSAVDAALAQSLAAHALSFYRPLPRRSLDRPSLLRWSLRPSAGELAVLLCIAAAAALLAVLAPLATLALARTLLGAGQRANVLLAGLGLGLACLAVACVFVLRARTLLRLQGSVLVALQAGLWDRLLQMPASFFRGYGAGELVGRAMGVSGIRATLGTLLGLLGSASFALGSLGLLLYWDASLALLALALAVLGALLSGLLDRYARRRQRQVSIRQAHSAELALQNIAAIAKIRVAGAEQRAFARWHARIEAHSRALLRAAQLNNAVSAWRAAYPLLIGAALLAAYFAGPPRLDPATALAFAVAAAQLVAGSSMLGTALPRLAGSADVYERSAPILRATPELAQAGIDPGVLSGAIEVSHVSFRYHEDGPAILRDVSLRVAPGETVAIVGPSGCGKSTLLRLLLGFERPQTGRILYDGHEPAALDLRALRRQLGVVLQHGTLMADSILNNITGASLLTVEDAWRAAELAGIAEEIRRLPMGMHTLLAEGGATLSGGQRQRLLIARAVAHGPRILFFDEATSALDNTAQALVTHNIGGLAASRLIIAHRLSTVRHADRIYVLENGSVVQSGTYAELIDQDGLFARLARRQIA